MTIFVTEPLDISQLPPFQLVPVDYETERTNILNGIVARFQARGVDYDVQSIETDSAVILAEEFAYRKTLDLAALNDAGKRLTLAFGYGAALDHIAATYYADIGVVRDTLVPANPATGAPAVMESDDRFRRRIQLAPDARTPGTLRGYEYWALTAAPFLIDAKAFNYASGLCAPGQVVVVVLGKDPDPNPAKDIPAQDEAAQLDLARNFLLNRNTKLGTDEVIVRTATRVPTTVNAVLGMRHGPDPSIVVGAARPKLQAYVDYCQTHIGELFAESGQKAALFVGAVEYVRLSLNQDTDPGQDGIVKVTVGSITPEFVGV